MKTDSTLLFSKNHEWLQITTDNHAIIGITDFAQRQLGDLVFIELPHIHQNYQKDQAMAVIESVKTASDVYCPVDATIIEINTALLEQPEIINQDPMQSGWLCKIKINNPDQLEQLLDEKSYQQTMTENA